MQDFRYNAFFFQKSRKIKTNVFKTLNFEGAHAKSIWKGIVDIRVHLKIIHAIGGPILFPQRTIYSFLLTFLWSKQHRNLWWNCCYIYVSSGVKNGYGIVKHLYF